MTYHRALNTSKCFEQCKNYGQIEILQKDQTPSNWLDLLAKDIHDNLSEDTKKTNTDQCTIAAILERLSEHQYHKELQPLLQNISKVMRNHEREEYKSFKITPTVLTQYAEKLFEGLNNCSAGFYERASVIVRSWLVDNNLSEHMETIRENIVQRTATELFNEVHAFSSVFLVAATQNFGVTNIGKQHVDYTQELKIFGALQTNFEKYYTPLLIIRYIEDQLMSDFRSNGYNGLKDAGYNYEAYGSWLDKLNSLLTTKGDDESWFIQEQEINDRSKESEDSAEEGQSENFKIIDLNWGLIRNKILQQLVKEQFIITKTGTKLDYKTLKTTDNKDDEYYYMLNLANPDEQKKWFDSCMVKETNLERLSSLLFSLPKEHRYYSEIKKRISSLLDNSNKILEIMQGKHHRNYMNQELVDIVLDKMSAIKDGELINLQNMDGDSFLMLTLQCHPLLRDALLAQRIYPLSRKHKEQQLVAQNTKSVTALSLAIKALPNTVMLELVFALYEKCGTALAINTCVYSNLSSQFNLSPQATFNEGFFTLFFKTGFQTKQLNGMLELLSSIVIKNSQKSEQLLASIAKLSPEQKALILTNATNYGLNLMMQFARYQPELIGEIIALVKQLPKENQAEIYRQCSYFYDWNALMLGMYYQPSSVRYILNGMNELSDDVKAEMLMQQSMNGFNVLNTKRAVSAGIFQMIHSISNSKSKLDILNTIQCEVVEFETLSEMLGLLKVMQDELHDNQELSQEIAKLIEKVFSQRARFTPANWQTLQLKNQIPTTHIDLIPAVHADIQSLELTANDSIFNASKIFEQLEGCCLSDKDEEIRDDITNLKNLLQQVPPFKINSSNNFTVNQTLIFMLHNIGISHQSSKTWIPGAAETIAIIKKTKLLLDNPEQDDYTNKLSELTQEIDTAHTLVSKSHSLTTNYIPGCLKILGGITLLLLATAMITAAVLFAPPFIALAVIIALSIVSMGGYLLANGIKSFSSAKLMRKSEFFQQQSNNLDILKEKVNPAKFFSYTPSDEATTEAPVNEAPASEGPVTEEPEIAESTLTA